MCATSCYTYITTAVPTAFKKATSERYGGDSMLEGQLPWYIGGPILGLCVVAIRLLVNGRLGLAGSMSEVVEKVGRRSLAFDWSGWLVIGVVAGAALFALLHGDPSFEGYGWLTATFSGGGSALVIGAILIVAGVLVGFGAKAAGGCTSGNGLSGNALGSPGSLAATVTFFAVAIAVSFAVESVI
jgi:uncharacterized protein